jgi:hypothetical protein
LDVVSLPWSRSAAEPAEIVLIIARANQSICARFHFKKANQIKRAAYTLKLLFCTLISEQRHPVCHLPLSYTCYDRVPFSPNQSDKRDKPHLQNFVKETSETRQ